MRARLVIESINFERGQDPKSAMGLGMEEKLKNYMKDANPLAFGDNHRLYWLQICAEGGRTDLVKYLLSKGYYPDTNDGAPLKLASMYGHYDTVKALVDGGASVHFSKEPAVWAALLNGNFDIAEFLLRSGAKFETSWCMTLDKNIDFRKYPMLKQYWNRCNGVRESVQFTREGDPLDRLQVGRIEERKWAALKEFQDWLYDYKFDEKDVISDCWDSYPYRYTGDEEKERAIFNGLTIDEIHNETPFEKEKYFSLFENVLNLTFWTAEICKLEYDDYKSMPEDEKESVEAQVEDEFGNRRFLENLLKYFIDKWPGPTKFRSKK